MTLTSALRSTSTTATVSISSAPSASSTHAVGMVCERAGENSRLSACSGPFLDAFQNKCGVQLYKSVWCKRSPDPQVHNTIDTQVHAAGGLGWQFCSPNTWLTSTRGCWPSVAHKIRREGTCQQAAPTLCSECMCEPLHRPSLCMHGKFIRKLMHMKPVTSCIGSCALDGNTQCVPPLPLPRALIQGARKGSIPFTRAHVHLVEQTLEAFGWREAAAGTHTLLKF